MGKMNKKALLDWLESDIKFDIGEIVIADIDDVKEVLYINRINININTNVEISYALDKVMRNHSCNAQYQGVPQNRTHKWTKEKEALIVKYKKMFWSDEE